MFSVDKIEATNYDSGVEHFVLPRQASQPGGDFFWFDELPEVWQTTRGFSRHEVFDKLFAPAHTIYQRPTFMRDRSEPDRQSCDEQTMPYASVGVLSIGHHGRPDTACRAEAAIRPTLPRLTSGVATVASYPEQSRQRRNPDDRVGMAFGLGVVTTDRVG